LWGKRRIVADFAVMSKNSNAQDEPVTPLEPGLAEQETATVAQESSEPDSKQSPTTPRRALGAVKALSLLLPVALFVFAADQLTKVWAESALELGDAPIPFIGTFIQFRLIYNPGAALSLASGQTWILTLVSL